MTQNAPKRYAHAYIRHFIIFAVFLPAYFSFYNHEYYQDLFPAGILAFLLIVNILHKWPLSFKRNGIFTLTLGATLLLYNIISIYTRKHYASLIVHWKVDQSYITVAFLFFITLLLLKEQTAILSDKVMKWLIGSVLIDNLIALGFRFKGIGRVHFANLRFHFTPLAETDNAFQWFYHTGAEYALLLLLYMAFFMVYRKLFYNIWVYALCQGLLILCISLTKVPGALLATGFLFGGALLHYLIKRFPVLRENVLFITPIVFALSGLLLITAFRKTEALYNKYLLWKGSLEVIRDNPQGFGVGFGVTLYETNYLSTIHTHAENTFLVHMQRHSTPVGIMFLLLFVVLIVFSIIRKPNFRSFGIWIATLLMLCMDFSLQTMNLPLVLFLIFCIFFRQKESKTNT